MQLDNNVQIGAAGFAHGGYAIHRHFQLILLKDATVVAAIPNAVFIIGDGINLNAVKPIRHGLASRFRVVLRLGEIASHQTPVKLELAGVSTQAIVGLAPQQLVNRGIEILALDIP